MTERQRFDDVWAREIERRFQAEVLRETKQWWTRKAIEGLADSHGLKLRWQSESLCFVSHPIGLDGLVALRVGERITDDQIAQLEDLKGLAAASTPMPT
ncbi:protein of unknown function [Magnetospirillum sp. XM-1]|uniref:hypothetical protein n=1 Tax=Magnetospirillum sp. XM-1 TaxID=1663591 RepID=UPI00073DF01B|nr:hypothetical protein [Magnetospirillum sp. XM-1]CUW37607.1 protein of unknown function [Magnetospirillum sp. XM-1]